MQGDSFELAVAVPIKNPHFDMGQYKTGVLGYTLSSADRYNFRINKAVHPDLQNHIQYNDQVMLGPSSMAANKDETEYITVSGLHEYVENLTTYDLVHFKNKNNEFAYSANDSFSGVFTGLAGGWYLNSNWTTSRSEGIKKGVISQQKILTQPDTSCIHEEYSGRKLLKIPMRQGFTLNYGFGIDIVNESDVVEYLKEPITSNSYSVFAVKQYLTNYNMLLGDYHRGGWRKDFAQRIKFPMLRNMPSQYFLKQDLLTYGSSGKIADKSLLIPYQYYRIGCKCYIDSHATQNLQYYSNWNLMMILRPHDSSRLEEEYIYAYLGDSTTGNKWIESSSIGLLKSGVSNISPPSISFWFQNNTLGGIGDDYGNLIFYVDDVYAEHAGGVNYANIDGCLKFSRYYVWPEQGTIEWSKDEKNKITLSFRTNYVSQEFWDQLEILLEWQKKGYSLNLHPYINDMPYVLTGKLNIRNIQKDSWDLTLRSFVLEFVED